MNGPLSPPRCSLVSRPPRGGWLVGALFSVLAWSDAAPGQDVPFQRGDANGDCRIDIADAVAVLNYQFQGGRLTCLDAGDTNDEGQLTVTSGVFLIGYLFLGSRQPPPPFGFCGPDPTQDRLGCDSYGCRNCPVLPTVVPTSPILRFSDPAGQFPPVVLGRQNVQVVPWTELPDSLTDAAEARLISIALEDRGVSSTLGERFAHISTDIVEPDKLTRPPPRAPVLLTFYSHTQNVAVQVLMEGTQVAGVQKLPEVQPAEGAEEVAEAISIARRDPRLSRLVANLVGNAILAHPRRGQPGFGGRVLYVSFGTETDAEYFALVDLVTAEVLDAGRAAGK